MGLKVLGTTDALVADHGTIYVWDRGHANLFPDVDRRSGTVFSDGHALLLDSAGTDHRPSLTIALGADGAVDQPWSDLSTVGFEVFTVTNGGLVVANLRSEEVDIEVPDGEYTVAVYVSGREEVMATDPEELLDTVGRERWLLLLEPVPWAQQEADAGDFFGAQDSPAPDLSGFSAQDREIGIGVEDTQPPGVRLRAMYGQTRSEYHLVIPDPEPAAMTFKVTGTVEVNAEGRVVAIRLVHKG